MSESDYQRGLRGGESRVSISDWDRYSDWKAGRDSRERQEDAEDEERLMQYLTPEEQTKRLNEKIAEYKLEEKRLNERERKYKKDEKERAFKAAEEMRNTGITITIVFSLLIIPIVGFLIQWLLQLFIQIPSGFIWGFDIVVIIIAIIVISSQYKRETNQAIRKYGERDKT